MDLNCIPSPCFVMEEARLRANLAVMERVQRESGARIIQALKGFACFHFFPLLRETLPGVTASSLNEARLGKEFFGGAIHACAPVYLPGEMPDWLERVSHITFNSLSQWHTYAPAVRAAAPRVTAALRVNPEHAEVATNLYNPGQPGSRLGIAPNELSEGLPEGVEGVHIHTLCECGADALERTWAALTRQFDSALQQARWLNVGGGHLMTRAGYAVDDLIALVRHMQASYGLEVILEPGAASVWRTGVLVGSIVDIVERRGVRTLMLDVSFAAHMPDCLEMPYKPVVRGARDPEPGETGWKLGGMTCLAGDVMGDYVFERTPQIGDKLVFEDMMHYTFVKTTMFNGVPHPAIGVWRENDSFELLRQFDYEDYRRRMG